jgi:hypothetical protein
MFIESHPALHPRGAIRSFLAFWLPAKQNPCKINRFLPAILKKNRLAGKARIVVAVRVVQSGLLIGMKSLESTPEGWFDPKAGSPYRTQGTAAPFERKFL